MLKSMEKTQQSKIAAFSKQNKDLLNEYEQLTQKQKKLEEAYKRAKEEISSLSKELDSTILNSKKKKRDIAKLISKLE